MLHPPFPLETKEILIQMRKKLSEYLISKGNGYDYEKVFGCDTGVKHYTPHILVRVSLGHTADNFIYKFNVKVDFHLPLNCTPDQAAEFLEGTKQAVKLAEWAESLTRNSYWEARDCQGYQP